jgi:tetratricopeptide (TPR) repeat protein
MQGELGEDLQNLVERFERAPESRLFAPLADLYRKNGDVDRAIELCEKGLEKYPDYASAHVILGKCFYDKGATERARGEFLRVLELDPENMVALKFMGDILLAEDKNVEATDYYKRLLSIDPTNADVNRILKNMKEKFEVKEIDLGAESARIRKSEQPRELATMTLAGIYAAQGYYNKALKIYQDVLQKEPNNNEAQEMVDKLQNLMESSEKERDDSFRDEVLTISMEDVSDELAESTSGGGIEGDDEDLEESMAMDLDSDEEDLEESMAMDLDSDEEDLEESMAMDLDSDEEDREESMAMDLDSDEEHAEEEPKAAPPPQPKKRKTVTKKSPSLEEESDGEKNVENFQSWLEKMQRGPRQ